MTLLRRDIWKISQDGQPWDPITLGYASAVRAMRALPREDPRSWEYQAAIHGIFGVTPPRFAPWNECQHATWFFLPWHRMYLYHFEQIVRSFVPEEAREDWALPYWDYSSGAPGTVLPPAFRETTLPDGSDNPLFVAERRAVVNTGTPAPPIVTDISQAMAETVFTEEGLGGSTGFGGPRTGWAHQGPAFGAMEASPHGPVHVWVGGATGWMSDPDTAALDPIFWLHHCNIDRLWSEWIAGGRANPDERAWLSRRFRLRNAEGRAVRMRPREVLDTVEQLDYMYDTLPIEEAIPPLEVVAPVPKRRQPRMVAASDESLDLSREGGSVRVDVSAVPEHDVTDESVRTPRTYLNLSDIEGTANPGVVFGVYLNLPEDASPEVRQRHLAGVVSFFGIEMTTPERAAESGGAAHAMRYSFDVTSLVDRLRAAGDWDPATLRITLLPAEGSEEPQLEEAAVRRSVRIGTFSIYQE